MRRNFDIWPPNNPRTLLRLVVGILLTANLVAGYFVLRPIGGSPQQLRQQAADLTAQIRQQRATLERTRALVSKIEAGRGQGDQFMSQYFMPVRTAYSTIIAELTDLATQSKITPKEFAYSTEPVEGSDTLDMMQISANYEADYRDLIHFVNLLDKTNRLLVIESLNAIPQQTGSKLTVTLKLDTFVTEGAEQ